MHSDVIYLVKNFRYKKESIEICSYSEEKEEASPYSPEIYTYIVKG